MKRKTKWIASLMLAGVLSLGGAVASAGVVAESENGISPSDLFEPTAGFTFENNVSVPDYMKYGSFYDTETGSFVTIDETSEEDYLEDWQTSGVKVTSTSSNKFVSFANVVDITGMTTNDEFLVFSPLATNRGTVDFSEMEFLLEDADDANNYIRITILVNRWANYVSMIGVSTQNFESRGYKYGTTGYQGDVSTWCSDRVTITFSGFTNELDVASSGANRADFRHRPFILHYDVEEMLFSITAQRGAKYKILDLNDGHSVGYGKEWGGFKNNRVRLSMAMRSFSASEASVMMFNVFGQPMNGSVVADTTAPSIVMGEEANAMPNALVGKAYPVYSATANDVVSGVVPVSVSVVDPLGVETAVTDGSFVPARSGNYELVYKAQDDAGNVAEKRFAFVATTALAPITVEVDSAQGSFFVGQKIPVYEAETYGGAGLTGCTVSVRRVGSNEDTPVVDGYFRPVLAGRYAVSYQASDYIGTLSTKTIFYEVQPTEKPAVEPVQQIKKFFDGVPVKLPVPTAYDYTTSQGVALYAPYTVTVSDQDGNYTETLTDGVFTPDKEKFGDTVVVTYVVSLSGDTEKVETFSYDAPLYERPQTVDEYFDFEKEDFTVSYNRYKNDEGKRELGFIRFSTAEDATGSKSISFVNPISIKLFEVAFSIPAWGSNFESFTVSLRDSANATVGIDMELIPMTSGIDKTTMTFVRSGGKDYAMKGVFNYYNGETEVESTTPLLLKYMDGAIVDYSGKEVFTPTVNFDGEPFTGFPSGKVYVTFTFNGLNGQGGLTLTKLSSQTLGATYNSKGEPVPFQDVILPTVLLEKDVPDAFSLGQTVEIPYAEGFDVLSPWVEVFVTLRAPDGSYLYQNAPIERDMQFSISSYGKYRLDYVVTDAAGKKYTESYTIAARDELSPDLVLRLGEKIEIKEGQSVVIPGAIVLDDRDLNPRLFVIVVKPDVTIEMLGEFVDGKIFTGEIKDEKPVTITSWKFTQKGKYLLRYYAVDSSYNATVKDVVVIVK